MDLVETHSTPSEVTRPKDPYWFR